MRKCSRRPDLVSPFAVDFFAYPLRSVNGAPDSAVSQGSTIGRVEEFVPRDFDVPRRLETPQFVLEPLDPEHNDQDYDAWTSSMEHIHATPGWQAQLEYDDFGEKFETVEELYRQLE